MLRVPRITRPYRTLLREGDRSALIGPDRYAVIEGALARRILDAVDGRATAEEIASRLEAEFGAARVYYTLLLLESEGLVEEGAVPPPGPAALVRGSDAPRGGDDPTSGPDGAAGGEAATRSPIAVRVTAEARRAHAPALDRLVGGWGTPPPVRDDGEGTGGNGPEVRGVLAIATDYLDPELRAWGRDARERNLPLLMVALRDEEVWVGPEIGYASGACLACLVAWLEGTHTHVRVSPRRGEETDTFGVRDPGLADELVSSALGAIRGWAVGSGPSDHHGVIHRWTQDAESPEAHAVIRRPDCAGCGAPVAHRGPPRLATRPKPRAVGELRIVAPEDTYARLRKHVSPLVGAVRHLTRVEGPGHSSVHTYTSAHAVPVETPGLHTLKTTSRDRCGGKGPTDLAARVSALCEALERYSAVYRGTELRVFGTAHQLGSDGVDPREILGFSEAQYADRESANARAAGRFHRVPRPFEPDRWMSWTPAWSLSELRTRFVPTSMCYFGYSGPGEEIARADSNGIAAGNCIEEAIVHGFLELVERDAVAIWWYNRTRQPEIALQRVADPYVRDIVRLYDRLGRRLWVLDLTTDLDIPVFAAVSARTRDDSGTVGRPAPSDTTPGRAASLAGDEIIMGFGAHLDRGLALRRALAELNQALPLALASDADRRRTLLPDHPLALHWWRTETLESQPYLIPAGVRTLEGFAPYESADLLDDVRECIVRARRVGLEVLCVDLTRPEIDLHAARVVVPGLRHFWRRLAPGRLYDVPVALGRLEAPLPEDALNPIPMFL